MRNILKLEASHLGEPPGPLCQELFQTPTEMTKGKAESAQNGRRGYPSVWNFKEILQEIGQWRPDCKRAYKSPICLLWRKKKKPSGAASWCSEPQPQGGPWSQKRGKKCWSGSFFWECFLHLGLPRAGFWGTHSAWKERKTKRVCCGLLRKEGFGGLAASLATTPQKMPAASQLPALSVPLSTAVLNWDPNTDKIHLHCSKWRHRVTHTLLPSHRLLAEWKKQKSVLGRKCKQAEAWEHMLPHKTDQPLETREKSPQISRILRIGE